MGKYRLIIIVSYLKFSNFANINTKKTLNYTRHEDIK